MFRVEMERMRTMVYYDHGMDELTLSEHAIALLHKHNISHAEFMKAAQEQIGRKFATPKVPSLPPGILDHLNKAKISAAGAFVQANASSNKFSLGDPYVGSSVPTEKNKDLDQ